METSFEFNIKGMVCNRCILAIKERLQDSGIYTSNISLGKLTFAKELANSQIENLKAILSTLGFELLSEKKEALLSDLKSSLSELVEINSNSDESIKVSEFLSKRFNKNYDSLSEFFSVNEGTTIEQYYIQQRVEKVKELLVYTDLSLNEIAYKTGYSSPYHLSGQFKRVTGLTPSYFKSLKDEKNSHFSNEHM